MPKAKIAAKRDSKLASDKKVKAKIIKTKLISKSEKENS